MRPGVKRLRAALKMAEDYYRGVSTLLIQLEDRRHDLSQEDRVDVAFLLREISQRYDALRKATDRTWQGVVNDCVDEAVKLCLEGGEDGPIRGELATGSPKPDFDCGLPKYGEPEYLAACKELGVPTDLVESEIIRLHFPGVMKEKSRREEAGAPPIKALLGMKPFKKHKMTLRRRKP